tara:strand:- start:7 stop:915 length:909 start_codon:yes stop_codon:yes gene_type:complete
MKYFITLLALSITLFIGNPALALFLGILLALFCKLPDGFFTQKYGSKILQTGIVFLGGSLSIGTVYQANSDYFLWVSIFVIVSFAAVLFLGKLLGVSRKLSYLLASGTAVCGGTAIASVAPAIKAKPEELTTALAIIFLFNALAVLLFPISNGYLGLNDIQFGAWVALAIHDTASVVGAASSVSEVSLEVAASLKVARTVWLVPLVIFSAWLYRNKNTGFGLPVFVIFFIFAALLNTFFQPNEVITDYLKLINKICLLTGLFCIGTQMSKESLAQLKFKPIAIASMVWLLIIMSSLYLVLSL